MLGCSAITYPADLEAVKAVLRLWDPIGVMPDSIDEVRDEYDGYAPYILSEITRVASIDALAAELQRIRTESMELPPRPEDDRAAAGRLVELREPCFGFGRAGFAHATQSLSEAECSHLLTELPRTSSRRAGVRNLLHHPAVQSLIRSEVVRAVVSPLLGPNACAIKATSFEKNDRTNWKVPWHQDRVVALAARVEDLRFDGWTRKAGTVNADAPSELLEKVLALRIHLDDCGEYDGPLHVIPGTHRLGKLKPDEVRKIVAEYSSEMVCGPRGTIVLLRPLLLHSSPVARNQSDRRILHIEFAAQNDAFPARWASPVPLTA